MIVITGANGQLGRLVVQQLLQNPKFDCTLLGPIDAALNRSERPTDSYSRGRLAELQSGLCGQRTH